LLIVLTASIAEAQVVVEDSLESADSLSFSKISDTSDSTLLDSLGFLNEPKKKSMLDHEVTYEAKDSMRIDMGEEKIYLYGDAIATYGDIKLEAGYIEINLSQSELHATSFPDSAGKLIGYPEFTQGDQKFDSEEMRYNFKTQRGLSKRVKTQDGESYIHGEVVKKDSSDVIYIRNGKYTTCEADDPHFYIHAGKLKIITDDKIITGPAYLTIAEIPTPLAVPFGYFPNKQERANGILIPTYGQSNTQGIFFSRGGYYFGVKDRMDFSITGDIYTRGSWSSYLESNYAKRYRYRGNYGIDLVKTIVSEKGYEDYKSFPLSYKIRWQHTEDPKAHPGRTFGANVNFGSPRIDQQNVLSTNTAYLRSNVSSSIRYAKTFSNTPFSFSASASSSQNANSGLMDMSVPTASLNMARVFPFKRKVVVGKEKPWEKIGVIASADGTNKVSGKSDTLFRASSLRSMENGLQITNQINAGYKIFKYLQLTPSVSNKLVGSRTTLLKTYDPDSARALNSKVFSPNGFWEGSGSVSVSTIWYGLYSFKSEHIKAMRHQFTPSASISYKPDYSKAKWGYYRTVQADSNGRETKYSIFEGGVYGNPGAQENGVINLSANNTFELKVRNKADSTGKALDKKIKLLDQLGFTTNYGLAKDSLKWAPLGIQFRTSALKGLQLNGGATLNPYLRNERGVRVDKFMFFENGKIGHWTAANAAMSWSLEPKNKDKKKTTESKKEELVANNLNYDDFIDYDLPWRLSFVYNIGYNLSGFKSIVNQTLGVNGDLSLTQNWKVSFTTNLDLRNQEVLNTTFNLTRNLHCWELIIQTSPFGSRQFIMATIQPKSGMLQDLKLSRKRYSN